MIVVADSCPFPYTAGITCALHNLCRVNGRASADCVNCPATEGCGPDKNPAGKWNTDASRRAKHAPHMGGANLGFADGHAKWWTAQGLENATPGCDEDGNPIRNDPNEPIRRLCPVGVS